MSNKPLVSVIVPIYNSESYLERCLDSLVNQTLQEIEIIAVNNGSTDHSLEILERYHKKYGDKLKPVTIPHQKRAGAGRNAGMKQATADYIGFCDSDDFMELDAYEHLYDTAIKSKADLVYSPFYHVMDGNVRLVYKLQNVKIENVLISGNFALWNKLYKKEILMKAGDMPTDFGFEDFAYYPVVVSHARSVAYCDHPTYYYVCREGSEVNAASSIRMIDPLKCCDYNIKHIVPKYRNSIMFSDVQRLVSALPERWIFTDAYAKYFEKHYSEYEKNELFNSLNGFLHTIKCYINDFKSGMPNVIYISGFNGEATEERKEYIKDNSYYDGTELNVLDESSCNIHSNSFIEKAYNAGEYNLVARYFALKKINETGGVFVDASMIIDAPFNYLKITRSFFGMSSNTEFTDNVFGGRAKQKIYEELLATFREDYFLGEFAPLSARMKNLFSAKYDVPLLGQTYMRKFPMTIFGPEVFQYDMRGIGTQPKFNPHFTHIKQDLSAEDSNVVVVDRDFLNQFIEKRNPVNTDPVQNKTALERLQMVTAELNNIKASNSWRFIQQIKRHSNNIFVKMAKKIYFIFTKRKEKKI